MNEVRRMLPLLCMLVEDEYGRSCGFSSLIGNLELPMSESSPEKDALYKPSFL